MKVTDDMIHSGLRPLGIFLRRVYPEFSKLNSDFSNRVLGICAKGHNFTRKVNYVQSFIDSTDGTLLRICIYTPKFPPNEPKPGILWLHGGGYAIGMPEQDMFRISDVVIRTGCTVIAPDYRRSGDAPYPAALDDCYQALLWMKNHAPLFHIRPDQLFVAGNSAGGGLTAALCLLARDRGEVSIAFSMPMYPMLDDRETPSCKDNDAPIWDAESNRNGWHRYLRRIPAGTTPSKYAVPARETDYRNLPPTWTFIGDIEPFYDETVQYVKNLRGAGVEVHFRIYKGCFHAFDMIPWVAISRHARKYAKDGLDYAIAHYFAPQPAL